MGSFGPPMAPRRQRRRRVILGQFVRGHAEVRAFEDFARAATPRLVGRAALLLGNLQDGQDLAQEVLIRVWRNWRSVRDLASMDAWTNTVMFNLAASQWRSRRRDASRNRSRLTPTPLAESDLTIDIAGPMRRLPIAHRKALILFYIDDMSIREIARELDAPEATVRVWLHRGRLELRSQLQANVARTRPVSNTVSTEVGR
jgi:RNA polymerase sigma-70 factor (ECF subfamily)